MKKLLIVPLLLLTGCVAHDPYYHQSQPVYVPPRPVYVLPAPVYVAPPPPRCDWVTQYDRYRNTYQNVRVCR